MLLISVVGTCSPECIGGFGPRGGESARVPPKERSPWRGRWAYTLIKMCTRNLKFINMGNALAMCNGYFVLNVNWCLPSVGPPNQYIGGHMEPGIPHPFQTRQCCVVCVVSLPLPSFLSGISRVNLRPIGFEVVIGYWLKRSCSEPSFFI